MGFRASSLDELGDGYGFRKVRVPLGVTAFGCNFIVYPPGWDGVGHYHDTQDELYLVHKGRARFDVDGETFVLKAGPAFELLRTNRIGEGTLATPALVDGRWYIRTESNLFAIGM